ncbi:hypothetical protein ACLB2K_004634 [Fragaria x ananassa]
MTTPPRFEFEIHDVRSNNYLQWASDVTRLFVGKGFTSTIFPPDGPDMVPNEMIKAQTLMFLRRHIHKELKMQYLMMMDPKELWDDLKLRFDYVHDVQFTALSAGWQTIRQLLLHSTQLNSLPCFHCGSNAHMHKDCRASEDARDT